MFIVLVTTGVVVWIIGQIVKRNIPKHINQIYGYRTKRSMRSQEAWDFAQIYSTELLIQSALIMIFTSILSLFVKMGEVIKSASITNLSNTVRLLRQQFGSMYQTVLIDKSGKGFAGQTLEVPAERRFGHAYQVCNFFQRDHPGEVFPDVIVYFVNLVIILNIYFKH